MLVWCDLETTGLVAEKELVLELALVVTDDQLQEVAYASWVTDQARLRPLIECHPVVQKMHTENGLWEQSLSHGRRLTEVEAAAVRFLAEHTTAGEPQLAGSTISFDRSFLARHLPQVHKHLHYRNLDVSSLNEVARRFWPLVYEARPGTSKESTHRGMDDIRQSIEVLKHYLREMTPERNCMV